MKKNIIYTVQLVIAALVILAFSYLFRNEGMQHLDWTFPYSSGAANFKTLFDWRISPVEYDKISAMTDKEHRAYRYIATDKTVTNTVNEYGYLLVALAARHIFPELGDIQGLILLQVLAHIMIALFIISYLLNTRLQRSLFFMLYAINPLVLHIVTFPFYYFWTVLPSVSLAIVWFKYRQLYIWVPIVTVVMLFSLLIRPTTLFLSLYTFAVAFCRGKGAPVRSVIVCSCLIFLAGLAMIYHLSGQRSLFHTVYIGIGAYSNPYGINKLGDDEGFKYYHQMTGVTISSHAIHGNWKEKEVMQHYNETLKQRYLQILSDSPILLLRNAVLNTVQAFGVGYKVEHPWSRSITILIGMLVFCMLVAARQWIWMVAILFYAASFTLYFPPIPAYLFGAYLLLVLGISGAVEKIYQWYSLSKMGRFAIMFSNAKLMLSPKIK